MADELLADDRNHGPGGGEDRDLDVERPIDPAVMIVADLHEVENAQGPQGEAKAGWRRAHCVNRSTRFGGFTESGSLPGEPLQVVGQRGGRTHSDRPATWPGTSGRSTPIHAAPAD